MARRTLICPECGLVELDDTDRCPACGLTALDDADPANRDAIDEAIHLRRKQLEPRWAMGAFLGSMAAAFVLGTWFGNDPAIGELAAYPAVIAMAILTYRIGNARLTPGWRAAIETHRIGVGDRELRRARWLSTTMAAMTICVVVVAIEAKIGIDALDFRRGDELARPWRLVTSAFTHAGPVHLIGNMVALLAFGLTIDVRVGRIRTAGILAVAAVVGALVQARYSPAPMVGFSGAIFGLIGATVALMPRRPALLVMQGAAIPLPTWLWSIFMMGLVTFGAWVDQRDHVAWVAHLGGFVAGALVALPMRSIPMTPAFAHAEDERRRRIERLATR